MAGQADISLRIDAVTDITAATEAGRKAREAYEKGFGKFAAGKGVYGDVLVAMSGLKDKVGIEAYYSLARQRRAMQRVNTSQLTYSERQKHYEALSDMRTAELVARRLEINEPLNKEISSKRLKDKIDDSLQAIHNGVGSNFVDEYREAKRTGNKKKLAELGQELAIKSRAATTILGNPDMVTTEQFEIAQSVKDAEKSLNKNTKSVDALTKVGAIAATEFVKTVATVMPTYWQEHVSRSYWGSKEAGVERTKAVGKGIGATLGAGIGAALGSAFGPLGTWIGLGVGENIGGTVGGLYGTYKEKELEAVRKSIGQVNERYRSFGIYRGQASVGYASAVEDTGMASAGDVTNMVHNSATLGARMMFGQVSENEMLMYSLMPGYFAAAMNGATDAELAEAYKADLEKLPPMFRTWVAESIGGGSLGMMAYVNSPMYDTVQGHADIFRAQDTSQMIAGKGYAVQGGVRAVINRKKEYEAFKTDLSGSITSPEEGIWKPTGSEYEKKVATNKMKEAAFSLSDKPDFKDMSSLLPGGAKSIRIVNNLVVDGNVVQTEENEIVEEMMRNNYAPTITSLLGVD